MIQDVATVAWKEWRELFLRRSGFSRYDWLIFVGMFGVVMPWTIGRASITEPFSLAIWSWLPLILVSAVVADTFAGERERHTLETLLASRLSDRAILFGKVLATVGYGWGITLLTALLSVVTVNLVHLGQGLVVHPAPVALAIVTLSLLMAGLASGAGILVSLRSSTVRQAQQLLSWVIMALVFVPMFGFRFLPAAWREALARSLQGDLTRLVITVAAVLLVLNVALIAMCMARFQRARLGG